MSMEIGQENINDNSNSTSLVQGIELANDVPVFDVQAQGLAEIGIRGVGGINGVFGEANGPATGQRAGVTGNSDDATGVRGSSANGIGVDARSVIGVGVNGGSDSGTGILGTSTSSDGVIGQSTSGVGVRATSSSTALDAESTGDVAIKATSPTTAIVAQGATGVVATGADKDGSGVVGRGAVGVQGEGPAQSQGVGVFGTGRIGVQGAADIGVLGGPPEGPLFSGPPILVGVTGNAPGDVKHGDVPAAYGGWFDALNGTAPLHLEPSADDAPPSTALRGDFFVDNSGRLWFCVAPDTASVAATWKQVQLV